MINLSSITYDHKESNMVNPDRETATLENLYEDVVNLILCNCDIVAVNNFSLVSKKCLQIARNDKIWRKVALALGYSLSQPLKAYREASNYIALIESTIRNAPSYHLNQPKENFPAIKTCTSIVNLSTCIVEREPFLFTKRACNKKLEPAAFFTETPSGPQWLKDSFFKTFKDLTQLDLSNCQLCMLPTEIGQLTSLKNLVLDYNLLNVFPVSTTRLTQLESLCFKNNCFIELPQEIFTFTKLECLAFENNYITYVSPAIANLSKLKNLYANGNYIKELPIEASKLFSSKALLHEQKYEDSWQAWFRTVILGRGVRLPFELPPSCIFSNTPLSIRELHEDKQVRQRTFKALTALTCALGLAALGYALYLRRD